MFDLISWLRSQTGNADLPVALADIKDLSAHDRREWLITNGLGSFASASITGANTRRHHGLLIAALDPPVSRTLLLSRLDEIVDGENLSTNFWGSGCVSAEGYKRLVAFTINPVPTWVFCVAGGFLVKQVAMLPGKQEVTVGYTWMCDDQKNLANLELQVIANARDFHGDTQVGAVTFNSNEDGNRVKLTSSRFEQALHFGWTSGTYTAACKWYRNYYWPAEWERGLAANEDCFRAGVLQLKLAPGQSVTVKAGLAVVALSTIADTVKAVVAHQADLLCKAGSPVDADVAQLVVGADAFLVHRASTESASVIAGYHWFNDWGRDSMISLPGLTLATGRSELARGILSTFQRYLSEGMLPNNFPDAGQKPHYNTADATFWWAWALLKYYRKTGDLDFVKSCLSDMESVVDWHLKGTRYGLHVDVDGLVTGGADGVQLTWMDALCGDVVFTPRRGKAVEINALWYNFLLTLAELRQAASMDGGKFRHMASNVKTGFAKFWNRQKGCLYDVLNEDGSADGSIRPNQLFAISLPFDLVSQEQALSILSVVESELLTPKGLRSLSQADPAYKGTYGSSVPADQYRRDLTYHQGTVWSWLIGPWVDARMKVYGNTPENLKYVCRHLAGLRQHILDDAGLGSISEIFDGNAPHQPQGCIAQAWSIAELLRVLTENPQLV